MKFGKEDHYEIELGDLKIGGVRPVIDGRITTKVGRVSMRGKLNGRDVKIFECANGEHASFVASLMAEGPGSRFFPDVYGVHKEFVVSEWVSGRQLTSRDLVRSQTLIGQLEDVLGIIHGQSPESSAGFDYVEDHIRPRFARGCRALGLARFFNRVENSWSVMRGLSSRPFISHPDLSPANMIVTKQGQVKIVDNELLNVSRAPWFDQMHVVHFIGDTSAKGARSMVGFLNPLLEMIENGHNGHLIDMWMMRMGGAHFVTGNVKGVVEMANEPITERLEKAVIWRTLRACFADRNIGDLE